MSDADLYRRAGAICMAAEPHAIPHWPCDAHVAEARHQLDTARHLSAAASTSVTDGPPSVGALVAGAAGREDRRSAAAPPSNEHRARVITPDPAGRAAATAQTESMP